MSNKAGVNYTYSAQATCNGLQRSIAHAVSAAGSNSYAYDCNGNMVTRNVGSTYTLSYDAESRLTGVSGNTSAAFVYDGDGNRVKGTVAGTTTAYVGNHFEWTGSTSTMKRYYYAGGQRIAVREGSGYGINGLSWLVGDHLGSTSITANTSGGRTGELRYKAWGEVRFVYGTTPTTYRYTGQRQEQQLGGSEGLYYYNARWYDPALGRFAQADTIVPEQSQGVQAWDRYAYANNNSVKYYDPTGHVVACGETKDAGACGGENGESRYQEERQYNLDCQNGTGTHCPNILGESGAIGVRIDSTGWVAGGADFNIDVLYFAQSNQAGAYLDFGTQYGPGGGTGTTAGLLFGNNLPSRSSYSGPSIVVSGADIPIPPLGITIEIDHSIGSPNPDQSIPSTTYVGIGPWTGEAGFYRGNTVAWNFIATINSTISGIKSWFD